MSDAADNSARDRDLAQAIEAAAHLRGGSYRLRSGQMSDEYVDPSASGAEVSRVLGVIDRESGGVANVAEAGFELRAFVTASQLRDAA